MNRLNLYILEKLKINSNSKINNNESPLFKDLDELINNSKINIIFDTEELRNYYNLSMMAISYDSANNYISLRTIIIKNHNKGYGSKFMEDLCDYADLNDKKISLTPTNDFGSHLGRLKKFYKRFGFIENKGKHHDFTTRDSMIRMPKNN